MTPKKRSIHTQKMSADAIISTKLCAIAKPLTRLAIISQLISVEALHAEGHRTRLTTHANLNVRVPIGN